MQDLLDENANTCEDAVALRQQFFQDHKNREFAKWKSQAIEARDKMNIAPNQRGWVDRHGLHGGSKHGALQRNTNASVFRDAR